MITLPKMGKPASRSPLLSKTAASPESPFSLTPTFPSAFAANYTSRSSPSAAARRHSYNDFEPKEATNLRKLLNEQIIDLMEREQDAIVLKLMREIAVLREENRALKSSSGSVKRSNSLSSKPRDEMASLVFVKPSPPSPRSAHIPIQSSLPVHLLPADVAKKPKRKLLTELAHFGLTSVLKALAEENLVLKRELETLKTEVSRMRQR